LIDAVITHLVVFVSLTLCGGLALLLANAVIPALVSDASRSGLEAGLRRLWPPIAAAALLLALLALARAIALATEVLRYIYPRLLL
jgi:hypothetical protein